MAYNHILADFTIGDRVELSPSCDLWMRGARFGEVVKVARPSARGSAKVSVRLDRTGHTVRFSPSLLQII